MSIRVTALYIFVAFLAIYAWKDWFKSLCGLILLMAVIEHPDMPENMFGIQGLNPWNVLFIIILLAWAFSRQRERLRWDMPRHIKIFLLLYLGVIVIGFLRAAFDRTNIENYSLKSLISDELINTIKWALPGILLFDGCRNRKQALMALACLFIFYFLISLQIARNMPLSAILSHSGNLDAVRNRISKMVGYNANEIAPILGGACWGFLALLPLVRKKFYKIAVLLGACLMTYALALSGSRTGYATWGATGLLMCLIKWRKYLLLVPLAVLILSLIFPGATARMLEGFGQTNAAGETVANEETITGGRTTAWPYVIDKIYESPFIGFGRLAMKRTGLYNNIEADHPGTGATHPHNLYLETLLDNGLIGSLPIWLFWLIVVIHSVKLFRCNNRLCSAIGGLSLALTLNWILAGIGGQHIYPAEFILAMWASVFLTLRVHLEEKWAKEISFDTQSYEIIQQSYDKNLTVIKTYE